MRKMKDSGIEWIGDIPEGWGIIPLKRLFKKIISGNWGAEPASDLINIICIRVADFNFKNFSIKEVEEYTYRGYRDGDIVYLEYGDILFEKSGGGQSTPVGRAVFFDRELNATCSNFIEKLSPKDIFHKKFIFYSFVTFYLFNYSYIYIKQTTGIQNFDLSTFLSKEKMCIPLFPEQQRIADYLDTKCARIDEAAELVRQSMEKLRAYKLSLITEAVTKGLDPDVPMKDSGIPWIGEIPERWDIFRFSNIATIKSNLVDPEKFSELPQVSPENIEKDSGKILYFNTVFDSGVISSNHLFFKGQILYSKIRPALNKVAIAPFDGLCSADMYPIESDINSKYLVYAMMSDLFLMQVRQITELRVKMPKINKVELSKIFVVCPPLSEQQRIADYLDAKCARIDALLEEKERLLERLAEYKKSLIFECVTGKREVSA